MRRANRLQTEVWYFRTMTVLHLPCYREQPKSVRAVFGGLFFDRQKTRYKSGFRLSDASTPRKESQQKQACAK